MVKRGRAEDLGIRAREGRLRGSRRGQRLRLRERVAGKMELTSGVTLSAGRSGSKARALAREPGRTRRGACECGPARAEGEAGGWAVREGVARSGPGRWVVRGKRGVREDRAQKRGCGPDGEGGRGLEGRREWFGPSTGLGWFGFSVSSSFLFPFLFQTYSNYLNSVEI